MSYPIVRFAPSPTGNLHIGGARTAIFNHAYARMTGGKFRIRIEDTDCDRSKPDFVDNILESLRWLGIEIDGDIWRQSDRKERHASMARELVRRGDAYYCVCTKEMIECKRATANTEHIPYRYDGTCRESGHQHGVIRMKTIWKENDDISKVQDVDDFIIMRGDGTPVYLFSGVMDDHDMEITHIIRGDDHMTNTIRQHIIWQALGWVSPTHLHLGLVHDEKGNKFSKRAGSSGVLDLRDAGYLPNAVYQYLLTMSWLPSELPAMSDERLLTELHRHKISPRPTKFDKHLLNKINRGHMKLEKDVLIHDLSERLSCYGKHQIELLIPDAIPRAFNLIEIETIIRSCLSGHTNHSCDDECQSLCDDAATRLREVQNWNEDGLKFCISDHARSKRMPMKKICLYLRSHLTGMTDSPSIFKIMTVLGKPEVLQILKM